MKEFDLSFLLETKSFQQLTQAEKDFVLKAMTEEEYSIQREFIQNSLEVFAEDQKRISPNPAILQSLQGAIRKEAEPSIFEAIFMFRIPAYQVAIAIVCFLFIWKGLGPNNTQLPIEKQIVVYQPIYDTIQVIKEVPIEKVVTVYKEVLKEVFVSESDLVASQGITPKADSIKLKDITQNLANTSLNNEVLNQFLVGVQ